MNPDDFQLTAKKLFRDHLTDAFSYYHFNNRNIKTPNCGICIYCSDMQIELGTHTSHYPLVDCSCAKCTNIKATNYIYDNIGKFMVNTYGGMDYLNNLESKCSEYILAIYDDAPFIDEFFDTDIALGCYMKIFINTYMAMLIDMTIKNQIVTNGLNMYTISKLRNIRLTLNCIEYIIVDCIKANNIEYLRTYNSTYPTDITKNRPILQYILSQTDNNDLFTPELFKDLISIFGKDAIDTIMISSFRQWFIEVFMMYQKLADSVRIKNRTTSVECDFSIFSTMLFIGNSIDRNAKLDLLPKRISKLTFRCGNNITILDYIDISGRESLESANVSELITAMKIFTPAFNKFNLFSRYFKHFIPDYKIIYQMPYPKEAIDEEDFEDIIKYAPNTLEYAIQALYI